MVENNIAGFIPEATNDPGCPPLPISTSLLCESLLLNEVKEAPLIFRRKPAKECAPRSPWTCLCLKNKNKPENPFQTMTSQKIGNICIMYVKTNFPT